MTRLTVEGAVAERARESQPRARRPYAPPRLRCLGRIAAIGLDPCDCPHYRKMNG